MTDTDFYSGRMGSAPTPSELIQLPIPSEVFAAESFRPTFSNWRVLTDLRN